MLRDVRLRKVENRAYVGRRHDECSNESCQEPRLVLLLNVHYHSDFLLSTVIMDIRQATVSV